MIRNPFFYRAADVRMGSMAEDRYFVNLFGASALNLLKEQPGGIWELPLLLLSAPGGGKSSLMRIFSACALRYVAQTALLGGKYQFLANQMEELGALRNGEPYALGIWLRMSDEYQSLDHEEGAKKHGLFCSMLNSRLVLSSINAICELNDLNINEDLERILLSLKIEAGNITKKSWAKWGAQNCKDCYDRMAELEAKLCELIDDPFWEGNPADLSHAGLWSLDLLANLEVFIDKRPFSFRPLIMLDDIQELSDEQISYLFSLFISRHVPVAFWLSLRKQALTLEDLLTERLGRGVEIGRDCQIIDFEKNRNDFRRRVLDVATLRVQSVTSQIGGLSQDFIRFISDDREEIFLKNLDDKVANELKGRIFDSAGNELERFRGLIQEIENQGVETHDVCRRLRMLEVLIKREVLKPQKSFPFFELPSETLKKHENRKAIVEAAELFLAKEYKLPYYFGASRLITLSSFNIQQFLKLAGALFEEIMMAIRLDRDSESFLSPERQHSIIGRVAKSFLREMPVMVRHGNQVFRFINAIGDMCKHETYRPTAPYAPGVTGAALTMYDLQILERKANEGEEKSVRLYQTIESAIAYNILESEPNYKCKGKDFLVLYLNRLLCISFQLPLQRGGFREQTLATLHDWTKYGYNKQKAEKVQRSLWS